MSEAEATSAKRPREEGEEEGADAAAAPAEAGGAEGTEAPAPASTTTGAAAGAESPSKKKLKAGEEATANGKPAAETATATAAASADADDEDVMASIIQKQKELEEAKARAAQKLNQKLGAPVVNAESITAATTGAAATAGIGPQAPQAAAPAAANPGVVGVPAVPVQKMDDVNRIYVGSLHYDLKEDDIRKVFAPFGAIREIVMSHDAATGRSKGFCFVDFAAPESAAMALQTMNGFQLAGRPIKVGRPTAGQGSQNPILKAVAPNPYGGGFAGAPGGFKKIPAGNNNARIYVGSIAFEVPVDVVKQLFESFGTIRSCTLLPDPNNPSRLHRGYGFIEFETEAAAQQALQTMNGFELYGRAMKVGPANPGAAMAGGAMPAAGGGYGAPAMQQGGWPQQQQVQQWGQQQWAQQPGAQQWGMPQQQQAAAGYGAAAQQWGQWPQQAGAQGGQQAGGQQQWTGY